MEKYTYYRTLLTTICLLISSFLLLEHTWHFGGIDLSDIVGHETYGIILFIAAVLIAPKIGKSKEWEEKIIKKIRRQ